MTLHNQFNEPKRARYGIPARYDCLRFSGTAEWLVALRRGSRNPETWRRRVGEAFEVSTAMSVASSAL